MPLSVVKVYVDHLGRKLPDRALYAETQCTLARVEEARRTGQPMRSPTLSASKTHREENESALELSPFTVVIAGSKVPVLEPSQAALLQKMDQVCPDTFFHNDHAALKLARGELHEVEVDETASESGRSDSTGSARSSASGGSSSCGSDSELDEDGCEPALPQLQPEMEPEMEPGLELPSQPQQPQLQLPQLPREEEEVLPHEQAQELPRKKPCQSAPTMAGGAIIVSAAP